MASPELVGDRICSLRLGLSQRSQTSLTGKLSGFWGCSSLCWPGLLPGGAKSGSHVLIRIQHERIGDSATFPLSSTWHHNFLGFALSAVFKLDNTLTRRWMKLKCQFKSNYGESYCISAEFKYILGMEVISTERTCVCVLQ